MGNLSTESFESFLESLKQAGVHITREQELRERLAEAEVWRYAFMSMAANGRAIGICFKGEQARVDAESIDRTFSAYDFPEKSRQVFKASLQPS